MLLAISICSACLPSYAEVVISHNVVDVQIPVGKPNISELVTLSGVDRDHRSHDQVVNGITPSSSSAESPSQASV